MILSKQVSVICVIGFALAGGVAFSARAMQEESRSDIFAGQDREQAFRMAQSYRNYLALQDMNPELTYDSRVQEAFLRGQLQRRNVVVQKVLSAMKKQLNEGLSVLQEREQAMSNQAIEKKAPEGATFAREKSISQPIACARSTRSDPAPLEDPSISLLGSNVYRESPLMQHHMGIRTLPGFSEQEPRYTPIIGTLPTGEPEDENNLGCIDI